MAKLGVVVGVADYTNPLNNLPACRNDSAAISEILQNSGRFDDILQLVDQSNTSSSIVKNRLSEFADKHRSSPIEEIVFYFTGHGNFDGNDFHYLLSDYDARKKNKTSLSNTELDGIFRSLNPDLFVKIVDACHSGVTYIKDDNKLEDYLKSPRNEFSNIYFMFSSQSSEYSYASRKISDFTKSLITAVLDFSPGPVRYRDLMSSISDEFEATGGQTPLFVVQAKNTEIFCDSSVELAAKLRSYLLENSSPPTQSEKTLSLKDRVLSAEKMFCTKEEAVKIVENIEKAFEEQEILEDIRELYSIKITSFDYIPTESATIGKWINENPSEELFAAPIKSQETYLAPDFESQLNSITRFLTISGANADNVKMVSKTRIVISEYKVTTTGLPFIYISIRLEPKIKAVDPVECHVAPILSRTKMVLFYRFRKLSFTDWEEATQKTTTKWARDEVFLKNEQDIESTLKKIWNALCDYAYTYLKEKYPDVDSAVVSTNGDDSAATADT
ncbi:caspase family protein [Acetobacter thailandicus]|uniref:caspase family protein n=1 Tax=Acetobacter thailandicus TaxID=1502842 RepID=UPI001BA49A2F|nr:caspase family protein [Acetobacter thailandicus]MBS0961476.1 caspase family protein [Acetobacter thailandicus]